MAIATDYNPVVQQLYIAYYGRPADYFGLINFSNQLLNASAPTTLDGILAAYGVDSTITALVNSFGTSSESVALYGSITTPAAASNFVTAIFNNVLHRAPLLAGLTYWVNAITNPSFNGQGQTTPLTLGAVALNIMQGALSLASTDATTIGKEVTVASNFTSSMTTATQINAYVGATAAATARTMLLGVTSTTDTTAYQATAATALNTMVSAATAAANPPQTFQLSTSVDTGSAFVGAGGNDTFIGNNTAGTALTLTALDSIDGGAGIDTLNITVSGAAIDTTTATNAVVTNIELVNITGSSTLVANTSTWTGVTDLTTASVGATAVTAATTTNATVTSSTTAAAAYSVSGGKAVTATVGGVTTGGTVAIGSSTTAGAIIGTVSDINTTAVAGSTVTVAGGTTVNLTQNITAGTSGTGSAVAAIGGAITVNGGAATTAVTVTQTAPVTAVAGVAATTAVTEVTTMTGAGALAAGDVYSLAGLTFTAGSNGVTQAQLLTAFASLSDGATVGAAYYLGTYSGILRGYSTSAVSSNVVTFTSSTAASVGDLTDAGTGAAAAVVAVGTQGVTAAAATTAVNGVTDGAVTINDANNASLTAANTITSVTLSGYGTATINDNALATLSLANSAAGVTVTDAATTHAASLALTVNTLASGSTITDNTITTLAVTSTGASSRVATLAAAAATGITIGGDKALTIDNLNAAAETALTVNGGALTTISAFGTTNKLVTVSVTGAGGLSSSVLSSQTALTSVDASGSSGPNSVAIDDTKSTYTGGSGVDTVTVTGVATKAINGGAGTADVLVFNAAGTSLTSTTGAFFTNFETLSLGASATGTYDLSLISGITALKEGALTAGVSITNIAGGVPLTITAAPGFTTGYALLNSTGSSDSLAVTMTAAAGLDLSGTALTANGIENVTITATDTTGVATFHSLALTDTSLRTLTISGNAGLALTNTDTTPTNVDASGLTGVTTATNTAKFFWTTGALAAASTIKGSATLDNTVNFSAATGGVVTYTGSAGNDTVTAQNGKNNVVNLGNGNNSFTNANTLGNQSVTGGTGSDTIIGGQGNDTIVGGGGIDTITLGTGIDKVTVSGGSNLIKISSNATSGVNTTTSSAINELANTFDVIYGLTSTDRMDLTGAANATFTTAANVTNLAGVASRIVFARGTYDATAGTFSYSSAGADSAMTWDVGSTTYHTAILVGYVSSAPAMDGTATGVIGLG